jgi:hypothetical protein
MTKECSINFLPDGSVKSIYHDEIFADSPNLSINRITDVEFDNATQEWFARIIKTGEVIARDKLRENVIKSEIVLASEMMFNNKEL